MRNPVCLFLLRLIHLDSLFRRAVDGSDRVREIDVLISGSLTGYPVRIAIECKNYGQTIDVDTIDSFVGKLDDIGVPRQHGIIVTVKGFSSGALRRAESAGIRALVLTGLTDDRLAAEIASAFMSIIYLLPVVTGWRMLNSVASVTDLTMMFTLYDTDGQEAGVLLDLVWWQWRDGVVPSLIGKHEVPVALPSGWHMKFDGKPEVPIRITYEITVFGLVLVVPGTAAKFGLLNAGSGALERYRIEASFEHKATSEHHPLAVLHSEAAATQFLKRQNSALTIVQRIRLPRLRSADIYWPISARARSRFEGLLRPDHTGRVPTYDDKDDVGAFLNRVADESRRRDCFAVADLMREVTGEDAILWGPSIVGFGRYHYKYASGREGDWMLTGFSPRKSDLTLYISRVSRGMQN